MVADLGTANYYGSTEQFAVLPSDSLSVSVQVTGTSPGTFNARLRTMPARIPESLRALPRLVTPPTPLNQLLPCEGPLTMRQSTASTPQRWQQQPVSMHVLLCHGQLRQGPRTTC